MGYYYGVRNAHRDVESRSPGCFDDCSTCAGVYFWSQAINRSAASHFDDGRPFGVAYYRRHANWGHLIKVIPWAVLGLFLALWVGELVNDEQFKNLIAVLVFMSIGLMLWQDKRKGKNLFPDKWWFAAFMGILGGFATMIGNVAGPVFAIYLLAMHLPKNSFIGTSAWFFMVINFTKFPLQYFVWNNIHTETLLVDLMTLPAIALGAFLGIKLVKIIPEQAYRGVVILITAISAFLLLI